ncbi:hypothetical protein CASFOL_040111 [Castilleja foliolosa]|uniref:Uncharacterized protein n=1 Tax=Castilleja foliolosa TaxID=1961234 RepID=A0ABD3BEV9_9LAMI
MLNRTLRESVTGAGRNAPINHRRGTSLNGAPVSSDDPLDLFSKSRRSFSIASSDESDVPVKLGRLSLGSARQGHSRLDDLLSSAEGGKNDYDWLLTPPGTPLVPSSDGNGSPTGGLMAPRSGPLVRSKSTTTKASRLSVSQSENNHHAAKPTRSSSVTRPSVSNSHYSTYSNKSTNILNTSSASVSSYIRSSTPPNRSSSVTRPSTPSRPSVSRSTTPARPRPSVSVSSMDKTRPSSNSRPSTPTSRSQISANSNSTAARTTSRPSTPTRRSPSPSLSPISGSSTPGGRSVTSVSRPSSPGPRARNPSQPIVLSDFPHDTPPNLRTSLPNRPLSAGRSRPGVALASKGNVDPTPNTASVRRQSSPVVTRGRVGEPIGKGRPLGNGHLSDSMDSRRDSSTRKPAKTSTDSTGGFGRTISKKSLDMAIRHMDIRNGSNGFRPITGSNLFPQSIRSTNQKTQPGAASANGNLSVSRNGATAENGYRYSESGSEEDKSHSSAKLNNVDIYESSRYDMILFKEDLKNSNWLHGLDDKSDQGSIFDNGEFLPEPFDPL